MRKSFKYILLISVLFILTSCKKEIGLTNDDINKINTVIVSPIIDNKNPKDAIACTIVGNTANRSLKYDDYINITGKNNNKSLKGNWELPDFIYARAYFVKEDGKYNLISDIRSTSDIIKNGYYKINLINEDNVIIYTFYARDFGLEKISREYIKDFYYPYSIENCRLSFEEIYIINKQNDKIVLYNRKDSKNYSRL